MKDIKEIIRQEIERLREIGGIVPFDNREQKTGYESALIDVEIFLDTIESEKPVPNDLDQAANEFANQDCVTFISRKKGFIAGAEWQKKQMMKDAFMDNYVVHDGRIELEGDPLPSLDPILILPYPQFKPGDKVKIIIIKDKEGEE